VIPIASLPESKQIKELVKANNKQEMARYLYYFWITRDAANPRAAWEQYQMEVKKVNDNYGTPLEYGFQTDRGRVYLQYGPPTEILPTIQEPGTLPYQIWQYNQAKNGQTNVKFVFYNRDLVTNNYVLIHSTANGEIRDDQWQRLVNEPYSEGSSPLDPGSITSPR
jgi:GWxTD domain-containing protein